MRISLNDIAKRTFRHMYSEEYWHMKYIERKELIKLIKEHIIKDLEEERYINLFTDVLSLMHAKAVNLDFIKIEYEI